MTGTPVETRSAMARLLSPRSVAIAGVSATSHSLAGTVLDNLERFGFAGDIHLIHPSRAEIRGIACVPDTMSLPAGVDCVVLAIPGHAVRAAVEGCAARGVGGIIIFSAGFAETGPEGRAVQDEIAAIARAAGMVIEGPNCLGMLNYVDGVPLTFSAAEPCPLARPGVAVVSQSGAMAAMLRAALHGRDIGVSYSVSTGNEAANGIEDFIAYLLDDPMTRAIALIAEQIRDPRRFLALAARARALGKPIVLRHPGKSSAAREAAATHTGAMAGDHAVMQTVVEHAGAIVVDTLEELVDVCEMVARCRVLPYGGTAILGESGALKAMMLDYCADLGLDLPQPTGAAAAAIEAAAPGLVVASNPLDLTAQPLVDPSIHEKTIVPLLSDPRCGSVVIAILLSSAPMARIKMPPVVDVVRRFAGERTMVFAMLGEDAPVPQDYVEEIRAAGVPFFRSPERALRALALLSRHAALPPADTTATEPEPAAPLPAGIVPEYRAKRLLADAGLPVAEGRLATTLEEARAAADAVGWPVVLKVQAPALSHKSDVGGVVLGLGDPEALAAGWARLHAAVGQAAPDVVLDGVLVEPMAKRGLELILGAKSDPEWGPVVMVGMGGVVAEALNDSRILPADASEARIRAELGRLAGAALLGPFRGAPARDVDAMIATVRQLGRFVRAHPEVAEIDINPLVVYPQGEGVALLDALMTVR